MGRADTTGGTMTRNAASGEECERRRFVERYIAVVRAYLGARWAASPLAQKIDDAVQEVIEPIRRRRFMSNPG